MIRILRAVSISTSLMLLYTPWSLADIPAHTPVPGGIAVLQLASTATAKPTAHYRNSPVMVIDNNQQWTAIVGLPLSAKPGPHQIRVGRGSLPPVMVNFDVQDKAYKTQHLTIANKRKVNPNPEDTLRIEADYVRITAAKRQFSEHTPESLQLDWPLRGRISSVFGLRRVYNGQPRKPHSGLDIAAPQGTAITAPLAGTVIEIGDFFFNGNTAFVDHGNGLITMYCHMSTMAVQPGDNLSAGDIIGQVGATGRVTGPHLHWSVLLNGQLVDPSLLLRPDDEPVSAP